MSRYFKFQEFFKTPSNKSYESTNIPNSLQVIKNIDLLASHLDQVRSMLNAPIYINSGFRSKAYNAIVGGVSGSYHTLGLAADIRADELETLRSHVLDYCGFSTTSGVDKKKYILYENSTFEICFYPTFIHFAVKRV